MKKEYEKPTTNAVKLQTTGILMLSQVTLPALIATMDGEFVEETI